MCAAGLQFDQEVLVEVVVFRHTDVMSGKSADRLLGFPERDHQKMRGIALDPTQRVCALVSTEGGRTLRGVYRQTIGPPVSRLETDSNRLSRTSASRSSLSWQRG